MTLRLSFDIAETETLTDAQISQVQAQLVTLVRNAALPGAAVTGVAFSRAEGTLSQRTALSFVIRLYSTDTPKSSDEVKSNEFLVAESYESGLGPSVKVAQKLLALNPEAASAVVLSPCDEVVHSIRSERGGHEVEVLNFAGTVIERRSWLESKKVANSLAVRMGMDAKESSGEASESWSTIQTVDYSNRKLGPRVGTTIRI